MSSFLCSFRYILSTNYSNIRKDAIYSISFGTAATWNKWVLNKSSSIFEVSPLSILDNISRNTSKFLGLTMILNVNSWNKNSHWHILHLMTSLLSWYLRASWYVKKINILANKNDIIFEGHKPWLMLLFQLLYSSFLHLLFFG